MITSLLKLCTKTCARILFADEDEFKLRNYETAPGESLKTIK